jgi:hypothetical protein
MDTNEPLISILQMLRQQAIYLHRQHGWIVALAETVRQNPETARILEQHPFYDQGPASEIRSSAETLQIIDGIIQQLKG